MALLTRLRASPHSSPCYLLFFFLHLNPCGSLSRGRKKRQKYLPRYQHLLPDETYPWPCMAISNPCWPFLPALSSPSSLSPPSQPCEEAAAQVPATLPAPAARCLSVLLPSYMLFPSPPPSPLPPSRVKKQRHRYLPRYQHLLPDASYRWPYMALHLPSWPYISLHGPTSPCWRTCLASPLSCHYFRPCSPLSSLSDV
ncbi:unnamed protein product [Closterium sp. NIES-54]